MKKWEFCVAITTAPRQEPTLRRCTDSLVSAGFRNLLIVAEPGVDLRPQSTGSAIIFSNDHRKGVWRNWLHAAQLALNTDAEFILMAQDDLDVVHPDTCEWVLDFLKTGVGPVSLYTPPNYAVTRGVRPIQSHTMWGACGFAFTRELLHQMTRHPLAKSWRGIGKHENDVQPEAIRQADVAIGRILFELGEQMWYPTPSLSWHCAKHSTLPGNGSNEVGRNRNARDTVDAGAPLAPQLQPRKERLRIVGKRQASHRWHAG